MKAHYLTASQIPAGTVLRDIVALEILLSSVSVLPKDVFLVTSRIERILCYWKHPYIQKKRVSPVSVGMPP